VLRLIAAGKSNREIARALFVQRGHGENARQPDLRQNRLADRGQAVHYAYTRGYAGPPA